MAGSKAVRRADADAAEATSKRARTEEPPAAVATADDASVNQYAGFTVPTDNFQIERVNIEDVTPQSFFEMYIATRTPVVLQGIIQDESFRAPAKWTNAYLTQTAGDEAVAVERRGNTTEKFGKGVQVRMKFKELLELIAQGDAMHYLTTQEVAAEEDGRPEIMAPFVAKLQEDFPLRPALLGNLIPQNINIWMGNNKEGSSSGLHHDYHDNLYILLRGKKRFRLYSPADAEKMYTRGELVRVHPNGRINYEGEETTAYGADPLAEAEALALIEKQEAELELALAEQAVENGEPGAQMRLEAAEDRLDKAMMSALRVERDDSDDEPEPEPEDGEFGAFHFDEEDDDEVDEEDSEDADGGADASGEDDDDDKAEAGGKVDGQGDGEPAVEQGAAGETVSYPVSFSRVDTYLLKDPVTKQQLEDEFPEFASAKAAFCDLSVGEMLFLPASWFHEVESYGSENGHLALNYWFHPPDQLDSFAEPYSSPFWPRDWEMRFAERKPRSVEGSDDDFDDEEGDDGFDDEDDDEAS